jgi:hypothetical protein
MSRFNRQELIEGWDQNQLSSSRVAVYGGDWVGLFSVWGLLSLGFREVIWLGIRIPWQSEVATQLFKGLDVAGSLLDHRLDGHIQFPTDLEWPLEEEPAALIVGTEDSTAQHLCGQYAQGHEIPALFGNTSGGGRVDRSPLASSCQKDQDPTIAMLVAGMLVDAVRAQVAPLKHDTETPSGVLELPRRNTVTASNVVLIGTGGIGVYAATLLAAHGCGLHLFDADTVEESNLNRQGLFTARDIGEHKATVAAEALRTMFPEHDGHISDHVHRIRQSDTDKLARLMPEPQLLVSAVDNAETRLAIQSIGSSLRLPVVHAGTDAFAADCYVQQAVGLLLDEQMHGALTRALANEQDREPRDGSCTGDPAYVVPGMIAGAMVAYHVLYSRFDGESCSPILWRSGTLPCMQSDYDNDFPEITL